MQIVRGAVEKNNAGRCVGRVLSFIGASLAQKALNEGGLTTSWCLATRNYSLILCLGGIIVMTMRALFARHHARSFSYI